MYTITLTLGNDVLKGKGETPLDALQSIKRPIKITTKGLLVISNGEKQNEHYLSIPRVKRLFYPLAQAVISKQLAFGL